jgi:hypothetical protein
VVTADSQAPESPPAMCPVPFACGLCSGLALEMARGPLKGAGDVVAAYSQAPESPPAMCPAPFACSLGRGLALEMAQA